MRIWLRPSDASNVLFAYTRCVTLIASPRLDVRDLRVVAAVASVGTTAAAAELLHLTQSAVSRALAVAEDHAGVELFDRSVRGLVPTAAGRMLVEAAPRLLADFTSLESRLKKPTPEQLYLRLAAECYMAYPWLARALLYLRERMPDARLELRVNYTETAIEALHDGKLDLALTMGSPARGLPARRLFEDELIFFVSASHPLAERAHLRPRDIIEHGLIATSTRSKDEWFLRQVFGSRRPAFRAERMPITEAIVELVRAGAGIGVLSEWILGPYLAKDPSLRVLRLRKGPLRRPWQLVHRPEVASQLPVLVDGILSARPIVSLP